jgi:hypothetical protein
MVSLMPTVARAKGLIVAAALASTSLAGCIAAIPLEALEVAGAGVAIAVLGVNHGAYDRDDARERRAARESFLPACQECCRICQMPGRQACGDACIDGHLRCTQRPGCACDALSHLAGSAAGACIEQAPRPAF